MVHSQDPEKYDRSHRIVLYDTDGKGKCVASVAVPELADELVDSLYEAKQEIWKRFKAQLLRGEVSPIRLYYEYNHMTAKDLARRVGLSESAVKRHCTLEGFMELDVRTLGKYAVVFGVCVGDFFQFVETPGKVPVKTEIYHDGVIQEIKIGQ